jgi:hypothetical protein
VIHDSHLFLSRYDIDGIYTKKFVLTDIEDDGRGGQS